MAQSERPSRQHFDAHYPKVRERVGVIENPFLALGFEFRVHAIFNSYWARRDQPINTIRRALELYLRGRGMVREAIQLLRPIHSEIYAAAQLAVLPESDREKAIASHVSARELLDDLTEEELADSIVGPPPPDLEALSLERDIGIQFLQDHPDKLAALLKREASGYRKDDETALVVEPGLDLLETIGFAPSKKNGLSRKAFFDALFDLLAIEIKRRPKPPRINMIAQARRQKKSRLAQR